MSVVKYILPVLAAAGAAQAQCSTTATLTIENPSDASALSSCRTFSGNIALATSVEGDITIPGVRSIDGSLSAVNVTNLNTISAPQLEEIADTFELRDNQNLASISMDSLTDIDTIQWVGLANLRNLGFAAGISSVSVVNIDNTQLSSIDGIGVDAVNEFTLVNNGLLTQLQLDLVKVSRTLIISGNGEDLMVQFPLLETAQNLTFRNCSDVKLPSLESVNGTVGFFSTKFESFGMPNLTTVGGLLFQDNLNLANLSLPELETVGGGFKISNNPDLLELDFPALVTVRGALDFSGNFTSVVMDEINLVQGAFNIQSSSDEIEEQCDGFKAMSGRNKPIRGEYQCVPGVETPGDATTNPTRTSSGSSATDTGAAGHLDVSSTAAIGLFGVLATMFGLL
ncbi:hypothetical protein M501DRAFT_990533 [Patellaria atrata CBS 101060]|uniref:GPI-anchored cell wall organization protein Ecm33 n=1 Tax=Patellaria atrata CBS 101060 TaxID=1346257 RepID=A0A9P4VP75_9PEZI|nr:hypothetical protein M501DRAFT_990533 [Patellaria atrata CBS 101060]